MLIRLKKVTEYQGMPSYLGQPLIMVVRQNYNSVALKTFYCKANSVLLKIVFKTLLCYFLNKADHI